MKYLYVYGAGYFGFMRIIKAINKIRPTYKLKGFIDDDPKLKNKKKWGIPVVENRSAIPRLSKTRNNCFFHNITRNPSLKKKIANIFDENKCEIVSLIFPKVNLDFVKIKKGCLVPEGCIIGSGSKIGNYTTLRLASIVSHDVIVEDFSYIGPGAVCSGFSRLKEGSFVGAGAVILPGRTIGKNSIVGAGSVVTRDISDNVVAYGNPAKEVRRVKKGEKRDSLN